MWLSASFVLSGLLDSNQRPRAPQTCALPTALNPDLRVQKYILLLRNANFRSSFCFFLLIFCFFVRKIRCSLIFLLSLLNEFNYNHQICNIE